MSRTQIRGPQLKESKFSLGKGFAVYVTVKQSVYTQHFIIVIYMFRLYEATIIRLHVSCVCVCVCVCICVCVCVYIYIYIYI